MFNKLNEDKRSQLVAKSRSGAKEKDGFTRYEKRIRTRVATSTRQYNKIDMNELFKNNILTVNIEVRGEVNKKTGKSNDYIVTMKFGGFLDVLHDQLEKNGGKLELRVIIRALVESFNSDDVYIHCSCPDWKYRMAYWATRNSITSGPPETRPSNITNPRDTLGAGCKHTLAALANHNWLIKVASVINNYIKYFAKHKERLFADIIFPAIYQRPYDKNFTLDMFDTGIDVLDTDTDTLDQANKHGAVSGQFQKGNTQGVRFASNQRDSDGEQIPLDIGDEEDDNTE